MRFAEFFGEKRRAVVVLSAAMMAACFAVPAAPAIEKQEAVDGSLYSVIAPIYTGTSESYVRFFNGSSAAASTFTVRVVGSPSGTVYGTATYLVPKNAAFQKQMTTILSEASAGALTGGDTGYSLYVQNSDQYAGYQHVVFSGVTSLFENAGNCKTPINQVMNAVSTNSVLISVHTSSLAQNKYPSVVQIHNPRNVAVTYKVTVYDEATGTMICPAGVAQGSACAVSVTTAANETKSLDFRAAFEVPLGWTPTAAQGRANLFITDPASSVAPSAVVGQGIQNVALNGTINMSTACAVNAVSSVTAVSVGTTFDGTIAGAAGQSGVFTVTVQAAANSAAVDTAKAQSTVEKAQVEKVQAVATASGALTLTGSSSTVTLTGTYNSATNAISLTGGGFTFTGSVNGGTYGGTYTGPNSTSGGFSALTATAAVKATAYCGTYSGGGSSGTFNLVVAANGALTGSYGGASGSGSLSGQVSGTSISARTSGGSVVSGTTTATSVSGSYVDDDGARGTYSGTTCAVPR